MVAGISLGVVTVCQRALLELPLEMGWDGMGWKGELSWELSFGGGFGSWQLEDMAGLELSEYDG